MKVKELKSLLNNEMYYVDLNGNVDEFLRIGDDYINGNNESLFIDFGNYVVKNLKPGVRYEDNKPVECLEIIETIKGEVNNLKNVTVDNFTEDGVEYLKLTGVREIDNEKYTIMLNKIKLGEIEIVKTDGKVTHIQLPLVAEDNGSVGQILLNNKKGEVNDMKVNLIPDLKFTNDRGEIFKIETQETVIRIGNSILLKHTPDISDELNKIFNGAKEVIIDLEYYTLDQNEKPSGITTRQVYVNRYQVREYYNTKRDKNDIVYLFMQYHDDTKELIEEYRYRQMLENLSSYRTCDKDSCFGIKKISEILKK